MEPLNDFATDSRFDKSFSSPSQVSQHRRYKRFQACVACRATKTKCLPSEQHDSCQSCLRSSRPCVMPGPPKQRIKSAQKFSELEKKIELLTNALAGRTQDIDTDEEATRSTPDRQVTTEYEKELFDGNDMLPDGREDARSINGRSRSVIQSTPTTGRLSNMQLDVVDEGLVTEDIAAKLYTHWFTNMRCFMPIVFLSPGVSMDQVRETKPLLFLTILTIASLSIYPSLSLPLTTRLTHDLGQQVFALNNQNVDIVLAMLLFSQYYFKPGGSSSVAPSQYIYSAVALSSDLGLHFRARSLMTKQSDSALEAAGICLSEWYAASMATVLLHRAPLVRHSPELEKYAEDIQNQQQSSNRWVFNLVKLQQIMEKSTLLLDPSENKSDAAFDEPSTQYKINMILQQLDRWEADLPTDLDSRLKQHGRHAAYLHIQKLAIRCYVRKVVIQKEANSVSPSRSEDDMMGFTPLHFDCLTKCIASIKTLFDIYLSLEVSLIRCLPNHYLSWNITAAFLLIKLGHFGEILAKLEQPVSGGSPKQSFQATVIQYLDSIAAKMEHASQSGYLPQARPYINILRKLKPYYLQKRAICINTHGDAVVLDQGEPTITHKCTRLSQNNDGMAVDTGLIRRHDDNSQPQYLKGKSTYTPTSGRRSQTSSENLSDHRWTPSSDISQMDHQQPPYPETYDDPSQVQPLNINAAYDPSTYANTDWSMLMLDQDQVEQIDAFMFSEDDISWMQSFL